MPPKGSGNNYTPLKPSEDSSLTYDEMEDISFRVSKLEDVIKGNVKIDDLVKLKNKMASKEDLKGMARKEELLELKELMKDIKHKFIPRVSTQKEDRRKKGTYSSHVLIKLKNNWRIRSLSPSLECMWHSNS